MVQNSDRCTFQAPKKDPKEYDEEDLAFLQRKKQEEAALKAAKDKGQSELSIWFNRANCVDLHPLSGQG